MNTTSGYEPVFEATRGEIVESVHMGAFTIVDAEGELLGSLGDPDLVTYLRSSAKPFQALPFIEQHGDERFGLIEQEIALMCASHSGTDFHLEIVNSLQHKVGLSESQLMCGTHPPFDRSTWKKLIAAGQEATPNRHNCSGKHTGMLAYATLKGYPLDGYTDPGHPVQRDILSAFSDMTGVPETEVQVGIDGCSVPTFAISMRAAAHGFARLCDPFEFSPERSVACKKITQAMSRNGLVVAGPERFDSVIMQIASGKLICKMGAEGYKALGILPGAVEPGSPAMGITVKVSDGDELNRARPMIVLQILRDMGILSASELQLLKDFDHRPVENFRHLTIGEYRPAFHVSK
jgi:L-asparaginase II